MKCAPLLYHWGSWCGTWSQSSVQASVQKLKDPALPCSSPLLKRTKDFFPWSMTLVTGACLTTSSRSPHRGALTSEHTSSQNSYLSLSFQFPCPLLLFSVKDVWKVKVYSLILYNSVPGTKKNDRPESFVGARTEVSTEGHGSLEVGGGRLGRSRESF